MAGAIDGSLQCIHRRLLAISASKEVESFYRAVQRAAKLQNTPPLICISLNKNSIYCYIPRSSKHTDTCNGWTGVFCNRSRRATKVTRNFPKSHFVVQIYQTDAQCGGSRNVIEEMTGEKRCLTVKISYPS